jgi:hypothetical protein
MEEQHCNWHLDAHGRVVSEHRDRSDVGQLAPLGRLLGEALILIPPYWYW